MLNINKKHYMPKIVSHTENVHLYFLESKYECNYSGIIDVKCTAVQKIVYLFHAVHVYRSVMPNSFYLLQGGNV